MIKKTIKSKAMSPQLLMDSFLKCSESTRTISHFLNLIIDLLYSFSMECFPHPKHSHSMDPMDSSIGFLMMDMMFGWVTQEEIYTVE